MVGTGNVDLYVPACGHVEVVCSLIYKNFESVNRVVGDVFIFLRPYFVIQLIGASRRIGNLVVNLFCFTCFSAVIEKVDIQLFAN